MRLRDDPVVIAARDTDFGAEPEAVELIHRVADEDVRRNARALRHFLLVRARGRELQRAQEARCAAVSEYTEFSRDDAGDTH